MRNILLLIYIVIGLVGCSEEKNERMLFEISEQVTQRYENAKAEFNNAILASSLELTPEFNELIELASKTNLSESEKRKIAKLIEREKQRNDRIESIIIELLQSTARELAFVSVVADSCENSALKPKILKIVSYVQKISNGKRGFGIIYSNNITELESKLGSGISEQECQQLSVKTQRLNKYLDDLENLNGLEVYN